MGVQIRLRLSKKCTVPRRFASPRRYLFSMIICLTTKSEEFVFDKLQVKTTTWPRTGIKREKESIIGLFSYSILISSILVVYQVNMK